MKKKLVALQARVGEAAKISVAPNKLSQSTTTFPAAAQKVVAKTFRRYVISVAAPGAAPKVTEQLTMLGAKAAHSPASSQTAEHTSASAQPAARMANAVIPTGLGSGSEGVEEQLVGGPSKTLSTHNADKSVSTGTHELHTGSTKITQLAGSPASEREMTSMQMLPLLRPLQPLAPFPGNDS